MTQEVTWYRRGIWRRREVWPGFGVTLPSPPPPTLSTPTHQDPDQTSVTHPFYHSHNTNLSFVISGLHSASLVDLVYFLHSDGIPMLSANGWFLRIFCGCVVWHSQINCGRGRASSNPQSKILNTTHKHCHSFAFSYLFMDKK